jgi:hypothetical protein
MRIAKSLYRYIIFFTQTLTVAALSALGAVAFYAEHFRNLLLKKCRNNMWPGTYFI